LLTATDFDTYVLYLNHQRQLNQDHFMADFLLAVPGVLIHEGGYANVAGDAGGETYAGITRKNFPNWQGWAIVDANKPLKWNAIIKDSAMLPLVQSFYKANFWDKANLDQFTSQRVASFTFDWYVNSGGTAIKKLQTAANALPADGVAGPNTVAIVNGCVENDLMNKLKASRIAFYQAIVAKDPSQGKFLNGWITRVNSF